MDFRPNATIQDPVYTDFSNQLASLLSFEILLLSASGSVFIVTEAELEEDETEVLDKIVKERTLHKTATQNDVEQNPESAPPATPFRFARYKAMRILTGLP